MRNERFSKPPRPATLPAGRGSLPAPATAFVQRARILDATARVVAARGYSRASVAEIHTRAGVSRRAFYAHFADKEDAVLQAFDAAAAFVAARALAAFRAESSWLTGLAAALATYLAAMECDRDWAVLCQVESLGAGRRAARMREAVVAPLLAALEEERPAGRSSPELTPALAAIDAAVRAHLLDDGAPLLSLGAELAAGTLGRDVGAAAVRLDPRAAIEKPSLLAAEVLVVLRRPSEVPAARLALLVEQAAAARDGAALWLALVGVRRFGVPAGMVGAVEAVALPALRDAWFFGLPLAEAGEGEGPWSVPTLGDRCVAYLREHPGRSAEQIRAARGPSSLAGQPDARAPRAAGPGGTPVRERTVACVGAARSVGKNDAA